MQAVVKYALQQDAALRRRFVINSRANWLITALVFTYPALYLGYGMVLGCWANISSHDKLTLSLFQAGQSFRLLYRPEVYLRDQSDRLYAIEKANIDLEKKGETPNVTSPIVLWH
eukprot:TRINITY_DN2985_c0_g2_i3.p1 TRINITY_DN2985_c0_g2~~TRINITY_DN2985_c0_g2_i3.p1  ORF type:complete len:115 (-),score=33.74 TRINITY_DN2985_c0_g2_i3:77-421(-)